MQQQELNQIRQKEANMTALAAIGPRKKRKMESPVNGAGAEVKTTLGLIIDYILRLTKNQTCGLIAVYTCTYF